jgi:hypothetical protein
MANVKTIIETARNTRNERGIAYLAAKDVAVLIRAALKKAFPAVKFSVRSDSNSMTVCWTDGPRSGQVLDICRQFTFGGFDGSIDLEYMSRNWLLPSGEMAAAESRGTSGSMGYVKGYATDCPEPGAVLVDSNVKYISPVRELSAEYTADLRKRTVARYGINDNGAESWRLYHDGETLDYWMRRTEELATA